MNIINKIKILLFLCISFLGCHKEEVDSPKAFASRTVLVYLGVDNNFRAEALQKLRHLKNSWSKEIDGNLLIYSDTGEKSFLINIYYSPHRGAVADTIKTYAAENSASAETLARVMNTVKAFRPAESYGLVVLSHGTGWLPAEMSTPYVGLKSIIKDQSTNNVTGYYMELTDFARAIPYKLDFIIFDACWMAGVEVAYELKDKADYIVASSAEVLEPGFVYGTMMKSLFKPKPDLAAVAREFYEYHNAQIAPYRSATVSVIKTASLDSLAQIVKEISINPAIDNIQSFGHGSQRIFFDMGDYLQKMLPDRHEEINAALDRCIPYKASTSHYYSSATGKLEAINAFSGLTVYIAQEQYPVANRHYGSLKWANVTEYAF